MHKSSFGVNTVCYSKITTSLLSALNIRHTSVHFQQLTVGKYLTQALTILGPLSSPSYWPSADKYTIMF